MKTARTGLLTLLFMLACSAALAKPATLGPVETLQAYQKALAANPPQLGVLWHQLPESYQTEVKELITEFAEQTDAELWDAGFRVLGKAAKVARNQGEYLRGSPLFAAATAQAGDKPFFTEPKQWDSLVSFVETIATSELSTHAGLKKLDPGKFLDTTGTKVAQSCIDLALASGGEKDLQGEWEKIRAGKFTLVEADDDSATVKFEAHGEESEIELTKVDDKWVFAELAEDFATQVKAARGALKQAAVPAEQKAQILGVAKAIEASLDELLTAKSQAEFDKLCIRQAEQLQAAIGGAAASFFPTPTGTTPTDTAPTDTAPTDTAPTDTAPTDTAPTDTPAPNSEETSEEPSEK